MLAPGATAKRRAAARAPATSAPQGLACGRGSPVLPEVKAMAATAPAGMEGFGAAAPGSAPGRSTGSGSATSLSESA